MQDGFPFISEPCSVKKDVHSAFMEGKFTVQNTNWKFSKIGLDHKHEQLNGKIKGVCGAIGLKGNDSSLQRWLLLGPETVRLIDEFSIGLYQLENDVWEYHDSNEASQIKFLDYVFSWRKLLRNLVIIFR